MGVDVNLYAEGAVSDAELAAANAYLDERLYGRDTYYEHWLARSEYGHDRIEFCTLSRYYGPSYERGDWPTIYGYILAMRAALPNCVVRYGGDTDPDAPEADDEYLAEIWEHFLGPHGADYRQP